jgi:hypothetical protein
MPTLFNTSGITKASTNRWFAIMSVSGESGLVLFGYAGEQNVSELLTGEPTLNSFLTEDELEVFVNEETKIPNYYKDSVENDSQKFQSPSQKYTPIEPLIVQTI